MTSFFDRLSYTDVAKAIDHSLLKPELDDASIEAGCKLAARYDVASVCVRPVDVRREGERHITVRWFNHTARVAMQTTPALGGPCGGGLLVQCVSAAAGSSISCMWTPP